MILLTLFGHMTKTTLISTIPYDIIINKLKTENKEEHEILNKILLFWTRYIYKMQEWLKGVFLNPPPRIENFLFSYWRENFDKIFLPLTKFKPN